jgi:soluble lytic murein transglycosylase
MRAGHVTTDGPITSGPRRGRGLRRLVTLLVLLVGVGVGWYALHQAMPGWYARLWFPLERVATIQAEAERYDVDPALVAAVIYEESGFVSDSQSSQGAVGLMQVLPSTARFVATLRPRPSPSPDRLAEPDVNIAYGSAYLHYLLKRYNDIPFALAAYNAGTANLDKWRDEANREGRTLAVPEDVPFPETRSYVEDVVRTRGIYARAYADKLR